MLVIFKGSITLYNYGNFCRTSAMKYYHNNELIGPSGIYSRIFILYHLLIPPLFHATY